MKCRLGGQRKSPPSTMWVLRIELRLSGLATDSLFLQPLSSPVTEILRAKARQSQHASLLDTNKRDSGSEKRIPCDHELHFPGADTTH